MEEANGADEVYRSLLYYQKSYKYPKTRRESLAREIKFFRNNKSRMEYERCIAGRIAHLGDNGWPIGNGVICATSATNYGVQECGEVPFLS